MRGTEFKAGLLLLNLRFDMKFNAMSWGAPLPTGLPPPPDSLLTTAPM